MVILFEGFLMSFTVSYVFERAVIFVMLNMCIANVTLHLMLTNMSKKPYNLVQVAYVYPLIPILASLTGNDMLVFFLTKLMCLMATMNFVFDITVLSK